MDSASWQPPLLVTIIDELFDAHVSLETILLNEKQALTHVEIDLEAIQNLSEEKQKILTTVSQLEKSLIASLAFSSLSTLRQQIEEAIDQIALPSRTTVQEKWQNLVVVVKRCKDLNDVNSAIVKASLSYNRKKLNILNSMMSTGIYDQKGSMV